MMAGNWKLPHWNSVFEGRNLSSGDRRQRLGFRNSPQRRRLGMMSRRGRDDAGGLNPESTHFDGGIYFTLLLSADHAVSFCCPYRGSW